MAIFKTQGTKRHGAERQENGSKVCFPAPARASWANFVSWPWGEGCPGSAPLAPSPGGRSSQGLQPLFQKAQRHQSPAGPWPWVAWGRKREWEVMRVCVFTFCAGHVDKRDWAGFAFAQKRAGSLTGGLCSPTGSPPPFVLHLIQGI